MKKLLGLLLLSSPLQAQDTTRIVHENYTTVFSNTMKYPVLVEWYITPEEITCINPVSRKDVFIPDPLLKQSSDVAADYVGSGFDRGHLSPAADSRCNIKYMQESFYFTNMAPQRPGLNRGQWKAVEEWTRELVKTQGTVFVQAGCVGEERKVKRLSIPTHCWKVVTIQKTHETTAFVFRNSADKSPTKEQHIVPIDSVIRLTRLKLK
jgi:endonuclease G